ncbi:phage tail protein [Variovorax sp. PDNC026]|uniref:phage tail tape measure protein n=1 Tax=Variovorax sp. PDNC026 TaxID=2811425 RepID=UPI001962D58A|nr:phage tail protein [Variovorax sp. PDNC026]QRY30563.1 phage tail protein [Variovorax sp. PDNC026]
MAGSGDLRLMVILQALDKASAPFRRVTESSSKTAKALREARDRLKELNTQQKSVGEFREIRAGLQDTTTKLGAAQARVKQLAQGLGAMGPPTKAMIRDFAAAKRETAALSEQHQKQAMRAQALRDKLTAAGISASTLGGHERRLRTEISSTTRAIDEQQAKLKQLGDRQRAMHAAKAGYQKGRHLGHNVAVAGAISAASGMATLHGMRAPIEESKKFAIEQQRIAALGMGDKITADAVAFGKGMKTYGTSMRDNVTLVRDGLSVFADLHHAEMVAPTLAKMKFANEAIYGEEQGHDNEKKFMDMLKVIELRGGLESEQKFKEQADIIQRVIAATGGRVQGEEWLNVIKTGGVAAKGLTDEAMYYQMEPLVQEMGGHRVGTAMMSAYSNIYQGKTTKRAALKLDELGLIADKSKVKHDKVGQVAQLGVGALAGSEIFRQNQFEWMEKILLPALAKRGITEKQDVLDEIGGMFSNRTASNLFAQMYLQREQIHKNAKLNAGADSIGTLYGRALQTTSGAELELAARRNDLYKQFGDSIMPAYVAALQLATSAMKGLTNWMAANPRTAHVLATGLGIVAVALVAIGGLLLVVAPLLLGFFATRFMFAAMGIQGGILSRVLGLVATGFRLVGTALLWIGRALLMNPIGLVITAIAVAAFLIYKYWGPISTFFSGLWERAKAAFDEFWQYLGGSFPAALGTLGALIANWSPIGLFYQAFAEVLRWFGVDLPAKFTEFGGQIMGGLASGITGALGQVQTAISGAADSTLQWFKEKLGIHSPSRVFMEAGGEISNGAALGITSRAGQIRQAALGVATVAASVLPLTVDASSMPRIDSRAPISAGAAQSAPAAGAKYEIHIHAAPGMSPQDIARAVSAELDRRERSRSAARRSSLSDID